MYDYDNNFAFLAEEELDEGVTIQDEVKNLLKQAGYNTDLMDEYGY